ncbi:MAG: hypothetical protein ABS49_08575 [Erythrobacter sp. SCN 62-14]|nr:MAG: hypothetical protein ABS49_08575 [Erythrobacter sp. SCN 62-14]
MFAQRPIKPALIAAACAALALAGCAGPYTGPVEVTRFVSPDRAELGRGTIAVRLADGAPDDLTRSAFIAAVSEELTRIGYTVVPQGSRAEQTATIRTTRTAVAGAPQGQRGPVNVGVGGQTGGFGSGVGMGVGLNLGGGQRGPNVNTELAVRIDNAGGRAIWEGRSQIATAVKSPYSQGNLAARTLASGLFRDFPGGNGETITIRASELQPAK